MPLQIHPISMVTFTMSWLLRGQTKIFTLLLLLIESLGIQKVVITGQKQGFWRQYFGLGVIFLPWVFSSYLVKFVFERLYFIQKGDYPDNTHGTYYVNSTNPEMNMGDPNTIVWLLETVETYFPSEKVPLFFPTLSPFLSPPPKKK